MNARRCTDCGGSLFGLPNYARLCKPCFIAGKQREHDGLVEVVQQLRAEIERLRATPTLDPQTMRKLLQLCHPDKHNGSAIANEVTTMLLSMRQRVAA